MMSQMLAGEDGGISLSKLLCFLGYVVPLLAWIAVGVGMAAFGWDWSDWQGWFIGGGGMAAGGIAAHGVRRATWKPPKTH